ncbi:MAG: four helix bundle protein [Akkermansia sp.]|nr:four helix bundle protein [Akkermansia sp.]
MDKQELQKRTQQFALRIIRLQAALPKGTAEYVLGKQLLRCGTSVGANYRAACLAKSRADFAAKLKICEEEADESIYWLELICMAGLMPEPRVQPLADEARQIAAIMAAACKTTREAG